MIVNYEALAKACKNFSGGEPYDHCIVDDFFEPETIERLVAEFPSLDSKCWHTYNNAIEVKKTCNNWNEFPSATYQVFSYLNSLEFVNRLSELLSIDELSSDPGLNGGGWHIHGPGGKLNAHLDYNIHPKLHLQRKINIIIYMNEVWKKEWGGQLGLWSQAPGERKPGDLVKSIDPVFSRAVLFDTTQDSWHGLPNPVACPNGMTRNSLAVYYLAPAPTDAEVRGKALFAPTAEQAGDREVLDLIATRAQTGTAASVYNKD